MDRSAGGSITVRSSKTPAKRSWMRYLPPGTEPLVLEVTAKTVQSAPPTTRDRGGSSLSNENPVPIFGGIEPKSARPIRRISSAVDRTKTNKPYNSFNKERLQQYSVRTRQIIHNEINARVQAERMKDSLKSSPTNETEVRRRFNFSSAASRSIPKTSTMVTHSVGYWLKKAKQAPKVITEDGKPSFVVIDQSKQILHSNMPLTQKPESSYKRSTIREALRDESILAETARRNGNKEQETKCYLKMGLLCEEYDAFTKAIHFFQKFLELVQNSGDTFSEALGNNHLGVLFFYLGGEDNIQKAIELHERHNRCTKQPASRFIANCNLGLCYNALDDFETSSQYLRQSLGYAIHLEDLPSQNLICEHLVLVAQNHHEYAIAELYLKKRLKILTQLEDLRNVALVNQQLAQVTSKIKGAGSKETIDYLETSLSQAETGGFLDISKKCSLDLGVALNASGDYQEAIVVLKRTMSLASDDAEVLNAAKCEMGISEGNLRLVGFFKGDELVKQAWN